MGTAHTPPDPASKAGVSGPDHGYMSTCRIFGFTENGREGICSQVIQLLSGLPGQRPHWTYAKAWTCVRQSGKSQG